MKLCWSKWLTVQSLYPLLGMGWAELLCALSTLLLKMYSDTYIGQPKTSTSAKIHLFFRKNRALVKMCFVC